MFDVGFKPVLDNQCRLLILGSLPGKASIAKQQYYGHPRNAFWPIMQQLFGIDAKLDYSKRLALLQQQHVGLWDVYATAARQGSLDSAINTQEALVNDFAELFMRCPNLKAIAFNGGLAYKQFVKLKMPLANTPLLALPSTSPAYAAMPFSEKLRHWQEILQYVR